MVNNHDPQLYLGASPPNPEALADPTVIARFAEMVEDNTTSGAPYTLGDLRIDQPTLDRLQVSPEQKNLAVGRVTILHEDAPRGERVRAITYNDEGRVLSARANLEGRPHAVAQLMVEKRTKTSHFEAAFNILDNETVSILGFTYLANSRQIHRDKAMRAFAAQWGLESAWDEYRSHDGAGNTEAFLRQFTNGIATRTLRTVEGLTGLPF